MILFKKIMRFIRIVAIAAVLSFAVPYNAYAACCGTDGCLCSRLGHESMTKPLMTAQAQQTSQFIINMFVRYKDWLINDYFDNYIYKALLNMTQQLTAVGASQVMMIGMMLDAKIMLETDRVLQTLAAEAHRDYRPSAELCTIGTAARGLASGERNAQMSAQTLSRLSLDRQLGNGKTGASASAALDRNSRLRAFKERYCDPSDNNNGLRSVCLPAPAGSDPQRINRDVDFTRTVSLARTLDVDFDDNVQTDHESDVVALGAYLYAHDIPKRPTTSVLKNKDNQDEYMDWRAIVAKRSVAQNSYHSIIGMKSAGNGDYTHNTRYVAAILAQLGMPQADAEKFIAPGDQPSYYALMEVLAQKIYQDDAFYTNLYDAPANVKRKDVAMQAIGLMLDRDTYRSELRYESMLSVLLEMELVKYQRAVQNRLNPLTGGRL